ncbi:MAG: hypothetical protein ACOY82_05735 [Pseudomonadota bacterium]
MSDPTAAQGADAADKSASTTDKLERIRRRVVEALIDEVLREVVARGAVVRPSGRQSAVSRQAAKAIELDRARVMKLIADSLAGVARPAPAQQGAPSPSPAAGRESSALHTVGEVIAAAYLRATGGAIAGAELGGHAAAVDEAGEALLRIVRAEAERYLQPRMEQLKKLTVALEAVLQDESLVRRRAAETRKRRPLLRKKSANEAKDSRKNSSRPAKPGV